MVEDAFLINDCTLAQAAATREMRWAHVKTLSHSYSQ